MLTKTALPDNDAAFKSLDTRLSQEMARCAQSYDQARSDLKAHHGKMQGQEIALVKQIAALQPQVDGLLNGTGPGLTKTVAQACLKYMELNAQLQKVRQGARLAYGATEKPGAQALGGAIGDPKPQSTPADMQDTASDTAKSVGSYAKSVQGAALLKGIRFAVLFKAASMRLHGPAPDPITPASVTPPSENPHFHQWFTGSKVTNTSGKPQQTHTSSAAFAAPKVVYHGTGSNFRAFDAKRNAKESLYGPGHYFTENKVVAASYLDHVKGTSASLNAAERKALPLREKARAIRVEHGMKYGSGILRPGKVYHVHSMSAAGDIQTHYHGTDETKAQHAIKNAYKKKLMSTDISSYSPHEKEDYHRSLTNIQDSHRASVAADNAVFKKQKDLSPKVHSLYLNIKKPFDVHNPAHAKEVAKFHGIKLGASVTHGGHYDGYYHLRSSTGGSREYDGEDNTHTYDLIKKAGFDGITHIGGIHTNSPVKHRVWIAMHDNQIKHVDNKGTFDPKTRDMYKALPAAQPSASIGGEAANIGAALHESHTRTTKPLWGKPQTEQAHMLSHAQPQAAIKHLRQSLASQGGTVSAIQTMHVPHADGTMAHKYSFEHTDAGGVKHVIHMMRAMPAPLSAKAPRATAARSPRVRMPAAPSSAPAPSTPKLSRPDFEKQFLGQHARAGTLPNDPKAREKMLNTAYAKHIAAP